MKKDSIKLAGSDSEQPNQKPDSENTAQPSPPKRMSVSDMARPMTASGSGVVEEVMSIAIGRPNKMTFFRVHPDFCAEFSLLKPEEELNAGREPYAVSGEMSPLMADLIKPYRLYLVSTARGSHMIWPVRIEEDGMPSNNQWGESAHRAAQRAMEKWVRMASDMELRHYRVYVAQDEIGEPIWPDIEPDELIELAFKDRFISDQSHPVYRAIIGAK